MYKDNWPIKLKSVIIRRKEREKRREERKRERERETHRLNSETTTTTGYSYFSGKKGVSFILNILAKNLGRAYSIRRFEHAVIICMDTPYYRYHDVRILSTSLSV